MIPSPSRCPTTAPNSNPPSCACSAGSRSLRRPTETSRLANLLRRPRLPASESCDTERPRASLGRASCGPLSLAVLGIATREGCRRDQFRLTGAATRPLRSRVAVRSDGQLRPPSGRRRSEHGYAQRGPVRVRPWPTAVRRLARPVGKQRAARDTGARGHPLGQRRQPQADAVRRG
jgi:hypothetical protein